MARSKMMVTDGPEMWRRRGMPRPIHIPTDSDEEAMENPPRVPNDADTEAADEARNTASPATQTYRRRTRASLITPPSSSPSVTTDTQGGNTPQETTLSTSHGQKQPRTPSPPPSPSPERQQETPSATPPVSQEEGELPSDLPKPTHPDHITQTLTYNKASERARLDKVSSTPYHPDELCTTYTHLTSLDSGYWDSDFTCPCKSLALPWAVNALTPPGIFLQNSISALPIWNYVSSLHIFWEEGCTQHPDQNGAVHTVVHAPPPETTLWLLGCNPNIQHYPVPPPPDPWALDHCHCSEPETFTPCPY
ncbi:cell surface glycoprotein 1-like [Manihot esculenta]|uniref:cell surface glycoprotein 1-like n=1 Tax=Manihot esculenta TaxID=3983 RepID=UPI000B5D7484|nr:cell surface glycoprotein 1-like [Manihot esculenta]